MHKSGFVNTKGYFDYFTFSHNSPMRNVRCRYYLTSHSPVLKFGWDFFYISGEQANISIIKDLLFRNPVSGSTAFVIMRFIQGCSFYCNYGFFSLDKYKSFPYSIVCSQIL